jgi:hypothetical protein
MGKPQEDLVAGIPPAGEFTHRLVIDIRDDEATLGEVDKRLEELWEAGRIKFVDYDPEVDSADAEEKEAE